MKKKIKQKNEVFALEKGELKSIKKIKQERDVCAFATTLWIIGIIFSAVFNVINLLVICALFFILFAMNIRYWDTKLYIMKMLKKGER